MFPNSLTDDKREQRTREIRELLKNKPHMTEDDVEFVLMMDEGAVRNGDASIFEDLKVHIKSKENKSVDKTRVADNQISSYDVFNANRAINDQLLRNGLPPSVTSNGIMPHVDPNIFTELPIDNFASRSDLYAGLDADPDIKKVY